MKEGIAARIAVAMVEEALAIIEIVSISIIVREVAEPPAEAPVNSTVVVLQARGVTVVSQPEITTTIAATIGTRHPQTTP